MMQYTLPGAAIRVVAAFALVGIGYLAGRLHTAALHAHHSAAATESARRVTGIGGVFFKAADPEATRDWYARHLGLEPPAAEGHVNFCWNSRFDGSTARTVWGPFSDSTSYFAPGRRDYMINFRVADLDGLLHTLREEGVTVLDAIDEYDYGRFAWILDLEGNKIELWEPDESGFDWALSCG